MACNNQNIKEIIHVSALGVSELLHPNISDQNMLPKKFSKSSRQFSHIASLGCIWTRRSFMNFLQNTKYSPIMPMALTKTQFQPIYINDLIEIILRCVNMIKRKKFIPMNVLGPKSLHYMRLLSSQGFIQEERRWLFRYRNL